MEKRLYGLDHLRALAIVMVFFYHYRGRIFGHPQWVTDYAKFGWTGVDLFFVLSGFLISSQLFNEIKKVSSFSLGKFYLKRLLRIVPAFLAVLIIYFCLPGFHEREALLPAWRYLTFTQNFSVNIQESGTFSHAWSLCVEEHFYLLFPLLLMLVIKTRFLNKSYLLLIVLFLFGFAARIYSWECLYVREINEENAWVYWYKYIYYPSYNRLDGLLIGVGIAAVYNFSPVFWTKISKFGNYFLVLGIIVLTGCYYLCYEEQSYKASVFGFPMVAVGYGLMLIGAVSSAGFMKRRSAVTLFIAGLSYSIYLTHKGVIHLTQQLFTGLGLDASGNFMTALCIAACIAAAFALNVLVERPFFSIRKKLDLRQKQDDLPEATKPAN